MNSHYTVYEYVSEKIPLVPKIVNLLLLQKRKRTNPVLRKNRKMTDPLLRKKWKRKPKMNGTGCSET